MGVGVWLRAGVVGNVQLERFIFYKENGRDGVGAYEGNAPNLSCNTWKSVRVNVVW